MRAPPTAASVSLLDKDLSASGHLSHSLPEFREQDLLDVEARLPLEDRAPSRETLMLQNKKLARDIQIEAENLKLSKLHIFACS
jgi:hypothetical protein